ncbi:hypothetical protein PTKIN_Ptkin13bG0201600 [Pterospermum kingtungense]
MEAPQVIFLSEARLPIHKLKAIQIKCNMDSCFSVDAEGSRGGLVMLWKASLQLSLSSFSKYHTDMDVTGADGDQGWRITRVYGEPVTHLRDNFWLVLRKLGEKSDKPWFYFGDFNEIL